MTNDRTKEARAAIEADDVEAAWRLQDAIIEKRKVRAALHALLERRLGDTPLAWSLEGFPHIRGNHRRKMSFARVRLGLEGKERAATVAALRARLLELPHDRALLGLMVEGGFSRDQLRTFAQNSATTHGTHHLPGRAALRLLAMGDEKWLAKQIRAHRLASSAIDALGKRQDLSARLGRALVDAAQRPGGGDEFALLLSHHDVSRALVERGLRSEQADHRAAALRHVYRIPDSRKTLLEALSDPATIVRRAALAALADDAHGLLDERFVAALERLVDDPDPYDERYNPRPVGALAAALLRRLR